MSLEMLILLTPMALAALLLLWFGWNREMKRRLAKAVSAERARRETELQRSVSLRDLRQVWHRAPGSGQISIAAIGSYAANVLPRMLEQLERAGAEDHVGAILLCEFDDVQRKACLRDMPVVFRGR